jgi:hypothetical protein
MNKFLEKYPRLREPRIGDKIQIIKIINDIGTGDYNYKLGDTGVILNKYNNPFKGVHLYLIDFENTKCVVYKDEFTIL